MSTLHAVVRVDHQTAEILQFDAERVQAQKVRTHTHHTAQHGSGVRTGHPFFGQVCDALAGIPEVLVAASKATQADFRRYIETHRSELARHVVGYETVDHPTTPQLVALARRFFGQHDRTSGVPTAG